MAIDVIRRRVPDFLARVDMVPFWDPDANTTAALEAAGAGLHYVPMSKAKHLYVLQDTRRAADRLGLRVRWPVDVDPCWEVPHLAWLSARRMGLAEPFYDAVIRARWQHGNDVCEPSVIDRLAQEVGADPGRLSGAVGDAETRAEGVRCLTEAWHDDVFGVPYLRLGRHRFWGLDRVEHFLDLYLPTLRGDQDPPVPLSAAAQSLTHAHAYDSDTAGGCG
jgi:2-hydroxychromene-2-carboxylate isomerase